MASSISPVALLLFTRSAGQDAPHKRFSSHGPRAGNAAIAAQLIGRAPAGRPGAAPAQPRRGPPAH